MRTLAAVPLERVSPAMVGATFRVTVLFVEMITVSVVCGVVPLQFVQEAAAFQLTLPKAEVQLKPKIVFGTLVKSKKRQQKTWTQFFGNVLAASSIIICLTPKRAVDVFFDRKGK